MPTRYKRNYSVVRHGSSLILNTEGKIFPRRKSKEYALAKVSVLMITYNQEDFIAQAIDSVLSQQVDFNYEIVVGDDCSTDNTKVLLLDYHQKDPDRIKLLLHKRNLGFSGKKNLTESLKACHGEYVAVLEGDDYWTSPHKLQKQVDFLDQHPQYAECFHDAAMLYEDGTQKPWVFSTAKKATYTLEDLVARNFIPTCSTMFRNKLFSAFPEWYYEVPMGDWPLHVINAHYGDIGYIDEVMAVYRVHSGGMWSSKDRVDIVNRTIRAAEKIKLLLNRKHRRITEGSIISWYLEIIQLYCQRKDLKEARVYAKKCLKRLLCHRPVPNRDFIRLLLIGYFPILYGLLAFKCLSNK